MSPRVFDLDNPQDVAALILIDRMATRALQAEKAIRALVAVINGNGSHALTVLARLSAEHNAPLNSWENEGGAL